VFIRVIVWRIWRYNEVMLVFLTQLSELLPFNLLSGFNSPPPPSLCQCAKVRGVAGRGGGHILQEFNTLYLNRFRTYKIARPLGCPRKCVFDFRWNTEFFEKHTEFREIPRNSAVFFAVKLPGIPRNSVCICIRNSACN
jgi:hypothetical protein